MARRVVEVFECDLCGGEGAQTVTFADRAIDLCKKDAAAFDKALKPYMDASKKVTATNRRKTTTVASNAATVRAWAEANGYDLPARGRIPKNVHEAFEAAQ